MGWQPGSPRLIAEDRTIPLPLYEAAQAGLLPRPQTDLFE